MDDNKRLSPEEIQVNKIVKDATENITKLENDIKKLEGRGTIRLNYNPPGMPNIDHRQNAIDKEKIETSIERIKADAIKTTDKITHTMPLEEQQKVRKDVIKELYKEVDQKQLDAMGKERKDISDSQEYLNKLKANYAREKNPESVTQKEQPTQTVSTRFAESLNHSKFLSKEQNQQLSKEKSGGKDDRE
ncbi:MAG: hypothetical protein J0L54_03830 [Chitinophagales bacterium]|nr:hypothetical protein [Chitinophagales bacterium]